MNRSFTARLAARTPRRLRDYLWATHRLFNESLAYLLKHYFWMQNLTDRHAEDDKKNELRKRFMLNENQLDRLRLIYRDMMGLDLPKDKRAGRSQSAQAWMEPITFSSGSTGQGPGESSKNIREEVKQAIRKLREENGWLFDRELAFPISPDNGFRRGLFGSAARRILNFEQNEETHREYYDAAENAFTRWKGGQQREDADDETSDLRRTGWRRSVLWRAWAKNQIAEREAELEEIGRLKWNDFEKTMQEFVTYERERGEKRAKEHGQPFDETNIEPINAAMTRGWRDVYEKLMPPDAHGSPEKQIAEETIKAIVRSDQRKYGDPNFFNWLADKPHLWRFVETMRRYNDFQRKLQQYKKPIQFRYPRHNRRPEWFSFSETSPGHMYTIVSMQPLVIELCVFAPIEDIPILKKLAKGRSLTDQEKRRLGEPIDWNAHRLTPERLDERRATHRAELETSKPDIVDKANLDAVHEWTDAVWRQLLDGFFRHDTPLDLSKFERVMVRYNLATDRRLSPFVESPETEDELMARLVVDTDERHKPRWQGRYRFWFGPLADASENDSLAARRRFLRPMPLFVGGIRLEYRGHLHGPAEPIFTLSCELDERIDGDDGKRVYPAPAHRIQKRESGDGEEQPAEVKAKTGKRRARKRRAMPVGLKVLLIDLGMRHVATGAVVEFVDDGNGHGVLPNPLRPIAVEFIDVPGVTLTHIQRHQDERRRKQRKACPRGKRKAYEIRGAHLPRGQLFASKLLDHAENLKDDRRKKAAHAIVRAALRHGVDYIVFENLKGYRPDMEFGRRVNASLMTWNRRELVEFVKMEAPPFGIHIYEFVPPHHTSRFCYRCGVVGHRFTHVAATAAGLPFVFSTGASGRADNCSTSSIMPRIRRPIVDKRLTVIT